MATESWETGHVCNLSCCHEETRQLIDLLADRFRLSVYSIVADSCGGTLVHDPPDPLKSNICRIADGTRELKFTLKFF